MTSRLLKSQCIEITPIRSDECSVILKYLENESWSDFKGIFVLLQKKDLSF